MAREPTEAEVRQMRYQTALTRMVSAHTPYKTLQILLQEGPELTDAYRSALIARALEHLEYLRQLDEERKYG